MYSKKVKRGFWNPYPITNRTIGEQIAPMAKIGLSANNPNTIKNNPIHSNRLTNAVAGNDFFSNRVFIIVAVIC